MHEIDDIVEYTYTGDGYAPHFIGRCFKIINFTINRTGKKAYLLYMVGDEQGGTYILPVNRFTPQISTQELINRKISCIENRQKKRNIIHW